MKNRKERRGAPRKAIIVPVRISGDGLAENMFYSGIIKDLSMTGISVETADKLAIGVVFVFEIYFPDNKRITPKGKVVWSKIVKNTHYYGVQFRGINVFDKLKLAKHIRILGKAK